LLMPHHDIDLFSLQLSTRSKQQQSSVAA